MNRLRSHISRFTIVLLVCIGFSFYMAKPAQANYSTNAFADWLSKKAEPANGSTLQQELDDLRRSNKHFNEVIEKASQIVSQNNEEFSLSIAESMATQQLCQLLLVEWNQFQVDNNMTGIPVDNTGKSFFLDKTKDLLPVGSAVFPSKSAVQNSSEAKYPNLTVDISRALIPMVNGIAIGAP